MKLKEVFAMKRAVILYHGFITDDKDFGRLYDYLESRYDHVERCLFPGHGDGGDYANFTEEATFKCLLDTFDKVREKYKRIDVIGFSMGGALSAYLATMREFDNLVLLAPANEYINLRTPIETTKFYIDKIKGEVPKVSQLFERRKEIEDVLHVYIKNERKNMSIAIKNLLPNYNVKNLMTFAHIIRRANENLIRIDNPTLLIWGKLDQLVPYKTVNFFEKRLTDERSQIKILDDVSHLMLQSENDQQIIDSIIEFLDKGYKKNKKKQTALDIK